MTECLPISCGCGPDIFGYRAEICVCEILTATLPDGECDQPYSEQIEIEGEGTFVIVSGSLPPGLTLNPTTGVISGVPFCESIGGFLVDPDGNYVVDENGDKIPYP